jgi:hypothetical protein
VQELLSPCWLCANLSGICSKFQVTVNRKTAQALGLSFSPLLLAQVDEVIE